MAEKRYRHEQEINRPPKGTLLDSPFGKICPPCHDTLHEFCDWGGCCCPCHGNKPAMPAEVKPEPRPMLPLSGVAWERAKTE